MNENIVKFILVALGIAIAAALASCSDEEGATKILEKQGYTNVVTDGHAFFSCPKDYSVTTKFEARAPNGQQVKGAVCRGYLFRNSIVSIEE
uniref:Lipoprotein n=1 Tax=Serratia phage Kevin TaxID=3161161 RepID=A0AAU8KWQ5_9CAUD